VKRDTELWLLVREIRAEYWKLAVMMEKWGEKLELAEAKLRVILNDPDGPAPQAGIRLDAASSSEGSALGWDEQTR
jgi:hypothetical protein